jgi:hypothetical protein
MVEVLLTHGMALGRVRQQPVRPLTHVLMGASDEAGLYVAEAADRPQARAEMIALLDKFIAGGDKSLTTSLTNDPSRPVNSFAAGGLERMDSSCDVGYGRCGGPGARGL